MSKSKKKIPIPPSKRGRATIYQFDKLDIGESMFIPDKTIYQVNAAYQQFRKKNPDYRLVSRKEENGCRIWRVQL